MANEDMQPSSVGDKAALYAATEEADVREPPQDTCEPENSYSPRLFSPTAPPAGEQPPSLPGTSVEDPDSDRRFNATESVQTVNPGLKCRTYRKRFYFIRHGQSQNNAVSLNDQTQVESFAVPSSCLTRAANKRTGEGARTRAPDERSKFRRCQEPLASKQRPRPVKSETSGATSAEPADRRVPDPSVTDLGKAQAAQAARWVQEHVRQVLQRPRRRRRDGEERDTQTPKVTRIICSPMRRSVETAAEMSKVLQAEVYIHPLLFEQGGLFRGPRKFRPGCRSSSIGDGVKATNGATVSDPARRDRPQTQITVHGGSQQESGPHPVSTQESDKGTQGQNVRSLENTTGSGLGGDDAPLGMTLDEILQIIPHAAVIPVAADTGDCHMSRPKSEVRHIRPERDTDTRPPAFKARSSLRESGDRSLGSSCDAGVGGGYRPDWAAARRHAWWQGGRETLIQTVQRARQVILWMEKQCLQTEETGGSILMIMHGLMMDLLLKALFFPFPSSDSPAPYLDLLLDFLRHQEALTGVPIYNLPQQAAYFPSSNCSFCCLELAARSVRPRARHLSSEANGCTPSQRKGQLRQPHQLPGKREGSAEAEGEGRPGGKKASGESHHSKTALDTTSAEAVEAEGVRLSFCASQEPRLVAALVQWNTPTVEPQLYTGHTVGASVLMSI
ncbi:phosphoglycerate mutase domain-containing protein [Neospora caninum Liverpool]|uniref:Phosphoglycerate mutase domain-containing protein n=1 Tax=Neospora caninum (strain Liverpool) TaxID=572307 RepID=F0VEY5_NEOCL|nr:phosphoglycerate mutase domain-containing protein [Neospora caninum Liverpool]CBZ52279.1 phosphoglycerate mutase domain-containing protein [Neospora caninum Liverpool]CEL66247.1 TPA: phosphoglycerate mutase domain-containing protein, putative [Neospora caninum Liverpool]|eukprot:XP_003882311.1 phosphoglycerate mutase domain-containing protein [Neospora caninum Liverpool]